MKAARTLSVILPAYNEEVALPLVLSKLLAYLPRQWRQFEVIVVDDGSTDMTATQVRELQARYHHVRLIQHRDNRGYGEALRSGFSAARYDWLLLMDADGQFDIVDLERLLPYMNTHELVLGYRQQRADTFVRALLTALYIMFIRALFGLVVRDVGCGFKLFTRRSWEEVQPIHSGDHKIFTVEWLWRAQRRGLKMINVPVRHFPRRGGVPTGARLDVIGQMVRELIRLRLYDGSTKTAEE